MKINIYLSQDKVTILNYERPKFKQGGLIVGGDLIESKNLKMGFIKISTTGKISSLKDENHTGNLTINNTSTGANKASPAIEPTKK